MRCVAGERQGGLVRQSSAAGGEVSAGGGGGIARHP